MSRDRTPPLVSADWLRTRVDDPDTVILDGTTFTPGTGLSAPENYEAQRLPGAIFFDINAVARRVPGPPHRMLPTPAEFAEDLSRLGLEHGRHYIVYDSHGLYSAARVWWMFRMHGYERISVLDGGLPAWRDAGGEIVSGPGRVRPRTAWPVGRLGPWVRDWREIRDNLATGAEIVVDVRPYEQFNGDTSHSYPGVRPGHIPGAVHLSQRDLRTARGDFLPKERIVALLAQKGLSADSPIVASCGSGVTACILSLAMDVLRGEPCPVYDGSWEEWGGRADLPNELDF
ncbi:sulfurtransferase [Acuticoccus mangrovi]|uniref:Sulfurtransferase n=1 Tax=Acuticoccus mangrovi TaxID=2796142 RepID=A0A934IHH9_9HYPH|nr:sulfurtransferase [Acuticoccus mangrovi]MBJ3776809.1 sulfurtransferase [Acuticoccus mangrovi]